LTTDSSVYPECAVIEKLVGRKVVGWPYVYDFARLDLDTLPESGALGDICIAVVELVTSAEEMDRRTKKYKDLIAAAFQVKRSFPKNPWELARANQLSEQAMKWAEQLYEGLIAIHRDKVNYELDLYNDGNWGLNSDDEAVWIDFGV
jgi:hypothetical protein